MAKGKRKSEPEKRRKTKPKPADFEFKLRLKSKVPVDLAFAWFVDLGENDHNGPRFTEKRRPGTISTREILALDRDGAVVRDVWGKEITCQRVRFFPGDRIEYEWSEKPEHFRPWSVWRFEPGADGDGCVITIEFMDGVSPGIARSAADRVRGDATGHVKEMEDDLLDAARAPLADVKIRRK